MSKDSFKESWAHYMAQECERILPVLAAHDIVLDSKQVHTRGERFLMSGMKVVLTGIKKDSGEKVVVKASSRKEGIAEIEHERVCRTTLHTLQFAGSTFLSPKEVLYVKKHGLIVVVNEFIEQPEPFLTRTLENQFELALRAFEMQESVHAATYSHARVIKKVFGNWNAHDYLTSAHSFQERTLSCYPREDGIHALLEQGRNALEEHQKDIERYCGFLTHEDFALHNLRIKGDTIYLIDYSSLRFGNKHESWARFINFMLLYNRPLEQTLVQYVLDNRSLEENRSLHLMRMYKTLQLIAYHAYAATQAAGNVAKLSERRVHFWSDVLGALLCDKPVSGDTIEAYKKDRDQLRSNEEKERQRELQQL